ncbi:MAG: M20/M25/M40 family metallo-hydrolase [Mycoplasma sp.]|nr:M20/M25/M40 family metallo-hydrolase [Candidatus Hennigella equi]
MEIREIENIEPKEVMAWFKKLCAIPHGSYHEEAISKWLAEVCKKAGCQVTVYPSGMILAKQKASKGCEDWPIVLLQSHMDMVLAKTDKCTKDLLKEPIEPYYDTETGQIRAFETSLGGDDCLGVACQLAIMHNPTIVHGPIEHLFTVNEEDHPGECVINELKAGDLEAKYYINIDAETFTDLLYGGAGCTTMKYDCPIPQKNNTGSHAYSISLTGLTGGHSGVNITRPHINPIEFMAQCAYDFAWLNQVEFTLSKFEGGPINNSLPIYAKMDVIMEPVLFDKFKRFLTNQLLITKRVAQGYEENAVLEFESIEPPKKTYSFDTSKNILLFAALAPNKVFTMAKTGDMMFSSSNLGFMSIENGRLKIDFKIRSFMDGEIQRKVRKIKSLGELLGFTNFTQEGQIFSFINDIKNNYCADVYAECYEQIVGKPIRKLTCPAGLECAIVCLKNPAMTQNTISVNTTLFNCHSPTEGISVPDTIKFWKVLKLTLSKLSK